MLLYSLSIELQCSFIRLLDPIGLISLSQTSKHFRDLINPAKEHFAERLLELETFEEYGGPTPSVEPRVVDYVLDYCQVERNDIRWACTSCLGLLPRRCFNNRSILDFDYQKPMRSSPQLDEPTSWEPHAKTDRKTEAEGEKTKEEWISLQLQPSEERPLLLPDAYESASELSGNNRQNRRCLECQYRRGELRPLSNGLGGNARVPIQANRQATFYSELDRSVLNEEEIAQLKTYREHVIRMWEQLDKDKGWRRDESVSTWAWIIKLCEDLLKDLKTCKEKSGEQPEVFAAWALDRDESTWDYKVEGAPLRELARALDETPIPYPLNLTQQGRDTRS
ncbi:hypothetical protein CEP54_002760 [Fusarium duplospermum]|uniref:F-box domain-containing protein n=1 Tax=Fusarium duplospermum TaxID=1325734 RepID=A0A428QTP4_9HYPO|nr:hypothetical protein CEP54_002760 [Fusarium duplospermum]